MICRACSGYRLRGSTWHTSGDGPQKWGCPLCSTVPWRRRDCPRGEPGQPTVNSGAAARDPQPMEDVIRFAWKRLVLRRGKRRRAMSEETVLGKSDSRPAETVL